MNFLFKVHTYLFYTIVACMFTSVFEMIYINDVRPALARAAFTLLQGTWFYQVCNHPWLLRMFGSRLISKGHLISKANFLVLIWTKKWMKLFFDFCPSLSNESNQKMKALYHINQGVFYTIEGLVLYVTHFRSLEQNSKK